MSDSAASSYVTTRSRSKDTTPTAAAHTCVARRVHRGVHRVRPGARLRPVRLQRPARGRRRRRCGRRTSATGAAGVTTRGEGFNADSRAVPASARALRGDTPGFPNHPPPSLRLVLLATLWTELRTHEEQLLWRFERARTRMGVRHTRTGGGRQSSIPCSTTRVSPSPAHRSSKPFSRALRRSSVSLHEPSTPDDNDHVAPTTQP